MINIWNTIKGYVAGAVALIACPCHLPITLPLLIALTAGTALGNWLAGNFLLVFILSSAFFIAGLVLAWKWLGAEPAPTTRAPTRKRPSTDLTITLVTSSACKSCVQARQVWQQISQERPLRLEVVDINTPRGREIAAAYNIFTTPTTLIDRQVVFRGAPSLSSARKAIGGA